MTEAEHQRMVRNLCLFVLADFALVVLGFWKLFDLLAGVFA